MYADKTIFQIAGQLMVAFLFLGTGVTNAIWKEKQHIDRMVAYDIPFPRLVLWIGFAMQFIGGIMVALDWKTHIGAAILIAFVILASAIFHRYWEVEDPLRRHFHVSFLFSNVAIIGALLLLM